MSSLHRGGILGYNTHQRRSIIDYQKTNLNSKIISIFLKTRLYIQLCKFPSTNHKLPIETGRWYGIDRENRQCLKCDSRFIGDEFHYIVECYIFLLIIEPN